MVSRWRGAPGIPSVRRLPAVSAAPVDPSGPAQATPGPADAQVAAPGALSPAPGVSPCGRARWRRWRRSARFPWRTLPIPHISLDGGRGRAGGDRAWRSGATPRRTRAWSAAPGAWTASTTPASSPGLRRSRPRRVKHHPKQPLRAGINGSKVGLALNLGSKKKRGRRQILRRRQVAHRRVGVVQIGVRPFDTVDSLLNAMREVADLQGVLEAHFPEGHAQEARRGSEAAEEEFALRAEARIRAPR